MVALVLESWFGDVDSVPDRRSVSGMVGPVVISGGDPFVAVGSFSGCIVPLTASDVDAADAGSGTAASTPLPSCIEVSVVIVFSRQVPLSATLCVLLIHRANHRLGYVGIGGFVVIGGVDVRRDRNYFCT